MHKPNSQAGSHPGSQIYPSSPSLRICMLHCSWGDLGCSILKQGLLSPSPSHMLTPEPITVARGVDLIVSARAVCSAPASIQAQTRRGVRSSVEAGAWEPTSIFNRFNGSLLLDPVTSPSTKQWDCWELSVHSSSETVCGLVPHGLFSWSVTLLPHS